QTYIDAQGKQQQDHYIFNAVFKLIEDAQTTIVLDMFLFNDEVGTSQASQRALTRQLTDALIVKRSLYPNIEIKVITDP
ncbi:phospholipase, partial [bacterium LRH843]|nr:phospholipase [bacterium LRH843]